MFYYLYKITNLINNRVYVGVHKTKDLNDGYMGSGKIIRQSIKKYGLSNFRKDILEYFDTYESMLKRESEIVNEEFLSQNDVYNLKIGGLGGFDYINNNGLNLTPEILEKRGKSISLHLKNNPRIVGSFTGKKHTEETKNHLSLKKREFFENGGEHPRGMLNKSHTTETKQHLSDVMKNKSTLIGKTGLEHPSGGTKWYNDGMKHKRSDVHPGEGWNEGRIFKERKKRG